MKRFGSDYDYLVADDTYEHEFTLCIGDPTINAGEFALNREDVAELIKEMSAWLKRTEP